MTAEDIAKLKEATSFLKNPALPRMLTVLYAVTLLSLVLMPPNPAFLVLGVLGVAGAVFDVRRTKKAIAALQAEVAPIVARARTIITTNALRDYNRLAELESVDGWSPRQLLAMSGVNDASPPAGIAHLIGGKELDCLIFFDTATSQVLLTSEDEDDDDLLSLLRRT